MNAEGEARLRAALDTAGGELITPADGSWRARLTATPTEIDRALEALRPLGLVRLADRSWRVRLAVPGGTLLVTVRAGVGAPVRLTCSSPTAERPRTWELVGMEPA